MAHLVQVGSILIADDLLQLVGAPRLDIEPYCGNWSVVKALDGFSLERVIHTAGWNFFFLADEAKVRFIGTSAPQKIRNALKRIVAKVKRDNFNSLEVTGIVARHFLGVPYVTVSAHSRHIQHGYRLQDSDERRTTRADVEWARG